MPSPRRIRLLSLAAVASVIVILFYTHPFSHDFYHRTVQAMGNDNTQVAQRHASSSNSIHAANGPPPEGAAPPPIDEHMRADAQTLPADRDADGDVDADDHRLASQLKERLKVAEQAAKDSANEKVLKPDAPSEIIGVGNAAGAPKPVAQEIVEEKKPAPAEKPKQPPPAAAPAAAPPAAAPKKPKEETLSPEARADKLLSSILNEAPVTIFSKTYCPHSKRAKALLLDKYYVTPAPHVVELDEHPQGSNLQDALLRKTGRRTVPNILVHGVSLGGADELVALDEGRKLVDKFVELGRKEVKITERL
ncbi:hypothetical protein NLU13_1814 [Sarocladium strictum]|uniref:Glutaredoxin domain-containing protein n=1 Tax=Sarocladium strictum TaxID=5046 RepID=A0AA39GRM9_SARSR|nr:hypothetical protein NLU13_1814 [Sarocladium strictum]